jgi:hypothetical protein
MLDKRRSVQAALVDAGEMVFDASHLLTGEVEGGPEASRLTWVARRIGAARGRLAAAHLRLPETRQETPARRDCSEQRLGELLTEIGEAVAPLRDDQAALEAALERHDQPASQEWAQHTGDKLEDLMADLWYAEEMADKLRAEE